MRINIQENYLPLEQFKEMFEKTSNIKDVYLLCHQAGCPVYVVRDNKENCDILWHPRESETENIMDIVVSDGVMVFKYNGIECDFEPIESLRQNRLLNHMLGKNPFDDNYCVWKRK